jgi:phenylpyruvate tautomerase PptA (4-oxalocrotonate tautomerase family)
MPLYTVTTQAGVLSGKAKAKLAAELTAFHSECAGIPKNWVHIVFQEYAAGNGFTAGEVAATAALRLLIRTGRSAEYKRGLLKRLWACCRTRRTQLTTRSSLAFKGAAETGLEMGKIMPDVEGNDAVGCERSRKRKDVTHAEGISVLYRGGKSALAALPRGIIPATALQSSIGPIRRRSRPSFHRRPRIANPAGAIFWFLVAVHRFGRRIDRSRAHQYREALPWSKRSSALDQLLPFIFVDNDAAIARGWTQGFEEVRRHLPDAQLLRRAGCGAAPGQSLRRERRGTWERLATAQIPARGNCRSVGRVQSPDGDAPVLPAMASGQSKPPVNELTMSLTDNLAIVCGPARPAAHPEVQGEEMSDRAARVGRGHRLGMSYSVTDLRILKNYAV